MPRVHDGLNPDQRLDVRVQSIAHELEFAIRRDERDGAVVLEAGQADTLVKFDVLHLHGLALGHRPPCRLEQQLVVESKLELGHARQVRLHLQGPEDLRAQYGAVRGDQEVQPLDHIEEDLVLFVLDALGTPGDGVGDCRRWPHLLHRQLMGLRLDVLAQDLDLRRLRVSVVHHLIQELVRDDEVVLDALLLELVEVVPEHLSEPVEERHDEGGVGVALRHRHEVKVVVLDPRKTDPVLAEHGLDCCVLGVDDVLLEPLRDVHGNFAAVITTNYDLPLHVHDEHRRSPRHGREPRRPKTAVESKPRDP
mmetsp:Transcript_20800/g.61968  ORF Transcript_20800/g.61968 Transcript_20800/m.61968 type:complete len:308 (-) Transcript_20800:8-931(-)